MRVQLRERPAHQRRERVEAGPAREHRVVGADADRALRHHERRERREARVVRRVDVHDVEPAAAEEDAQRLPQERRDRVQRLRVVAVHRQREAGADDLERLVALRALVAVDDRRRVQQAAGDDRHLVAAGCELGRLAVHVLGDAPELRVVVVRDDRDAHAEAEDTLGAGGTSRVGTVGARVPIRAPLVPLRRCRRTTTSARTVTASSSTSGSPRTRSTECIECGAPVRRVLHAPSIHYKGSGFYSTDYGSKKRGPNGAGQESKSESSLAERLGDSLVLARAARPRRARRAATARREEHVRRRQRVAATKTASVRLDSL